MLLLDTCALLWIASDPSRFPAKVAKKIAQNAGSLFVSAISAFEIGVKHRKGALVLPISPSRWYPAALEHHGILELPVSGLIAVRATELPAHHMDPADRILIATAEEHRAQILTPDTRIAQYRTVEVVWN